MNDSMKRQPDSRASRWVALLRHRAEAEPDAPLYSFLRRGSEVASMSVGELDRRARAIAAALQRETSRGERALLLYPPGLDFAPAFFGCLLAGVVAVPAPPPIPDRSLAEVARLARASGASLVLSTTRMPDELARALATTPSLRAAGRLSSDAVPDAWAEEWRDAPIHETELAVVTATPFIPGDPGLSRLTHAELFDRIAWIQDHVGPTQDLRSVTWLPPHVDMGLSAGVLQPLYGRMGCALMSPLEFLRQPLLWLEAIGRLGAQVSGGPEFSYALCTTALDHGSVAVDLSCWEVALVNSRARESTLAPFARALANRGFREEAFVDCTVEAAGGASWFGCHGDLTFGDAVLIDPETTRSPRPNTPADLWLRTTSLGEGYWERRRRPARTWPAYRGDTGEGPFLATGEEGLFVGSRLVLRGRSGDAIRLPDGSVDPDALEDFLKGAHTGLEAGAIVVFGVEAGGEEQLIVAAEFASEGSDLGQGLARIRECVEEYCGARPDAVIALVPGAIDAAGGPSLRRNGCRSRYLDGTLAVRTRFGGDADTASW